MMILGFCFVELVWFLLIKCVVRNGFKQVSLFEECINSIIQVFYGVLIILVNLFFPNDKHNWSAKFKGFFLHVFQKNLYFFVMECVFEKKHTPDFQYIHSSYCRINHANHNNQQSKIPTVYFLCQRRMIQAIHL